MFNGLWRLLRQQDYVDSLLKELEIVRNEKHELQETLFRTLKIHLIPNNRDEYIKDITKQQVETPVRNSREYLNKLQKESWDLSIQQQIKEEEANIQKLKEIKTEVKEDASDIRETVQIHADEST